MITSSLLIFILFFIYLFKCKSMNDITKYFSSIFFLILSAIPCVIGLLLFDHSMLSKSDLLQTTGMWFWVTIILSYTSIFFLLNLIGIILIHPSIDRVFDIDLRYTPDSWLGVSMNMILWCTVAGLITWCRNGNFLHFIGNSFIVIGVINLIVLSGRIVLNFRHNRA